MNNMPDHVFISHSSKDFEIANKICDILESHMIKCWIAPRDIPYGSEYAEELVKGITSSSAFLIIITNDSASSPHVRNEVEIAVRRNIPKFGIIVDDYTISGSMEYHFSRIQLTNLHRPVTSEKLERIIVSLKGTSDAHPTETTARELSSTKHNLPALIPMVSREAELNEICSSLGRENQVFLILGLTGIGKKTLANNVAHKLMRDGTFDIILWVTAQDGSLTLASFLEQIALIFDNQYMNRLEQDEKESMALNLLQQKAVLVVINGLQEVYDEKLIQFLNRFTYDDAVIITSDINTYIFDNCRTITLKGLSKEETRELVKMEGERIGIPNIDRLPEKVLADLNRLTTGNPYVIKLSIGQVKAGIPFERVLLGLQQARGRVFDDLFAKTWSLLDDDQRDLMMCLSIFRGSASVEALRNISGGDDWDFDEDVSKLISLSLVETNGAFLMEDIRYSMLPLTRNFAKAKLSSSPHENEYQQNFVEYFSAFIKEKQKDFKLLTTELDNLRFMLIWLKENQAEKHLSSIRILYPYFRDTGYWDEAIENLVIGIDANRTNTKMKLDLSFARCEIVSLLIRRTRPGDLEKSDELLNEALAIFEETENYKGLCAAWGRKARVAQKRKNYKSALDYGLKALRLAEEHSIQFRIADLSHEIGDTYFHLNMLNEAKNFYTNSLELYRELEMSVRTIGRYNDLGRLELRIGNLEEAKQLFLQAISLAEENNKLDTLSRAYINLAETFYQMDNMEMAKDYARKGSELASRLQAYEEMELAKLIIGKIPEHTKE